MSRQRERYSYLDEWKSLWEPDLEAIAFNGTTCDPTRVDPKVLQWAKQNCAHKPHFIKIVNIGAAHDVSGFNPKCQLTVPAPFVKEHFRELERVVTLENDEGKTWRVSFGRARAHPQWLQGWKRVAADNDLKCGDVMVFVLVANSRFHFTCFNEDGDIRSQKRTLSTVDDRRTSLKLKRAAEVASRSIHSTQAQCSSGSGGFDGHGHEAPSHKQVAEAPIKRRRLRKVAEITSNCKTTSHNESNLGAMVEDEHPLHDCVEAGSTSMAADAL